MCPCCNFMGKEFISLAHIYEKLGCMGMPSCFADIFSKGNNSCDFLFVSMGNIAFPKKSLLLAL